MLLAPPHWRTIDFISDLHLQESDVLTFGAWQSYMRSTRADAVFVLGDLFEVWVGDDAGSEGFESRCAQELQSTALRLPVFFMHGNRDFLVGPGFMTQCSATLLDDPTAISFGGQHWLLSHGDALCLADTEYQQFRKTVRSAAWQRDFLARPLAERKAIARDLRAQSAARKRSAPEYADVDEKAAADWLRHARATHMIHGHTHKPASHRLGDTLHRIVLSDWDVSANPPRAEVLRLSIKSTWADSPNLVLQPQPRVSIQRISPTQA